VETQARGTDGYEARSSFNPNHVGEDASRSKSNLESQRVDELDSENKVAAQLARVEAHLGEESQDSALTSMSVERRKSPGEKETAKQPGR